MVSFYEDTGCTSFLYSTTIDDFTDCFMVPNANDTFYGYARGTCSVDYSVTLPMDSVYLR